MQAKNLMTPQVECVAPGSALTEAAQRMKSLDVGFLPVCENDRLIGTVTDRDMVLRVIAEGKDPRSMTVRDVMTSQVFWCDEDQTIEAVADYMKNREVRRLLIVNRDKRLTGVISIGDLAKRGDERKAGETIRTISEALPAQAA